MQVWKWQFQQRPLRFVVWAFWTMSPLFFEFFRFFPRWQKCGQKLHIQMYELSEMEFVERWGYSMQSVVESRSQCMSQSQKSGVSHPGIARFHRFVVSETSRAGVQVKSVAYKGSYTRVPTGVLTAQLQGAAPTFFRVTKHTKVKILSEDSQNKCSYSPLPPQKTPVS